MALGAEAVWCGTAFLATPEAYLDSQERGETDQWTRDVQHRKLVSAMDEDTRIGRMYSGKTMRHVYNAWSEAWERPEAPPTLPMPLQGMLVGEALRGAREGKIEELVGGPAGNISGLIKEVRSAKVVMESMIREAEELLERMSSKG
jgi:NAD(P)H-dependent flavin oxidoreductase YrpB (nitropropane dioxygenase family)